MACQILFDWLQCCKILNLAKHSNTLYMVIAYKHRIVCIYSGSFFHFEYEGIVADLFIDWYNVPVFTVYQLIVSIVKMLFTT